MPNSLNNINGSSLNKLIAGMLFVFSAVQHTRTTTGRVGSQVAPLRKFFISYLCFSIKLLRAGTAGSIRCRPAIVMRLIEYSEGLWALSSPEGQAWQGPAPCHYCNKGGTCVSTTLTTCMQVLSKPLLWFSCDWTEALINLCVQQEWNDTTVHSQDTGAIKGSGGPNKPKKLSIRRRLPLGGNDLGNASEDTYIFCATLLSKRNLSALSDAMMALEWYLALTRLLSWITPV